jgi:triacylglycerol lipase
MIEILKIFAMSIALILLLTISNSSLLNSASGQTLPCDNGPITGSNMTLPVILVHGYNEDSTIWSMWEQLLTSDGIPFCTVTFHQSPSGDACGSAADHAMELAQIVQHVKTMTGQNRVNIVGHSKGGLDARLFLANTHTADVANLIMIGTPNAGDILANLFDVSDPCKPAIFDLEDGAADTIASQNTNTNYYTIAGVCLLWPVPNDGLVPVSSVESLGYAHSLGNTLHCHMSLLSEPEYQEARSILTGG